MLNSENQVVLSAPNKGDAPPPSVVTCEGLYILYNLHTYHGGFPLCAALGPLHLHLVDHSYAVSLSSRL